MIKTACALDCWDACSITCDSNYPNKLIATPEHPFSNGSLCSLLNRHIHEAKRITKPMINGEVVSLKEALDYSAKVLAPTNKSLLWRGSGNLGVMQSVTDILFSKINGSLTYGSLCDGAGQAGIVEGRGVNYQLSPSQIAKADVIVVWGRNIPVTNSHLMPFIEGKKLVVIDPVKTSLAKRANLHIQIKPRTDFYLAIMLARFITMEDSQNDEWLERFGSEFEEFYDFTRTFRIKAILEYMGLSLDDIGNLLTYLQEDRVLFLVGNGVQKYSIGHYVLWAIDSLGATLGLFGKEGSGVSYLGNSKQGFDNPFRVDAKRETIVTTPFEKFDTVLIQGGNPAESMPNSSRVIDSLKRVKNLIYFGLYENESSKLANIIIPAKNFLEKDDLRLSYGHHYVERMNRVFDSGIGISEYDFTKEMFKRLNLDGLKSQDYYLNYWIKQCKKEGSQLLLPDYQEIPYQNGFGKGQDDEFIFIDDFDDEFENIKPFRKARRVLKQEDAISEYWLLTPKARNSLNTQFKRQKYIHIPPSANFRDGDLIKVSSEYGEIALEAKVDDRLRDDCVLIYVGTKDLNYLTPPIVSEEGHNACYQEVKVKLSPI